MPSNVVQNITVVGQCWYCGSMYARKTSIIYSDGAYMYDCYCTNCGTYGYNQRYNHSYAYHGSPTMYNQYRHTCQIQYTWELIVPPGGTTAIPTLVKKYLHTISQNIWCASNLYCHQQPSNVFFQYWAAVI